MEKNLLFCDQQQFSLPRHAPSYFYSICRTELRRAPSYVEYTCCALLRRAPSNVGSSCPQSEIYRRGNVDYAWKSLIIAN